MKKTTILGTIAILIVLLQARPAYAYLDPASGSYFLQFLLAGLLAAVFSIKMFWKQIRFFVANLFSKGDKAEPDDE